MKERERERERERELKHMKDKKKLIDVKPYKINK